MIRTRIEVLDKQAVVDLTSDMLPSQRSAALAAAARALLSETQEENARALGYPPTYDTFVDGRIGASLDSVRPDGYIVFEFNLLSDLFSWIHFLLTERSPVLTHRYQKSHLFFADMVEADPLSQSVPQASEYVFVNQQPYARKIERGLSKQAPDGVYEGVAALAKSRFGNVAQISFGYRSLLGGPVGQWASVTSLQHTGYKHRVRKMKPHDRQLWLTRQPAIIITMPLTQDAGI